MGSCDTALRWDGIGGWLNIAWDVKAEVGLVLIEFVVVDWLLEEKADDFNWDWLRVRPKCAFLDIRKGERIICKGIINGAREKKASDYYSIPRA